jgi:hypothetical protein
MTSPAPSGHAFLSYVHEDAAVVDRLERILVASGVPVWRDTRDLWPGEDWREKIRKAIADDSLAFIACFSPASVAREKSYQNEELVLAVEQIRLRPPDSPWLIPVRLGDCQPPDYALGAGRRLSDLHWIDLFPGDTWDVNVIRLVQSVQRVLQVPASALMPATVVAPVGVATLTDGASAMRHVKALLREPSRQIELEDDVLSLATAAREQLVDLERFPTYIPPDVLGGQYVDHVRYLVGQTLAYWSVVEPVAGALIAGCAWGLPEHDRIWSRAIQSIARTAALQGSGHNSTLALRRFPTVALLYAGALAAVHRGRYDALKAIAIDAEIRTLNSERLAVISDSHVWGPFDGNEDLANAMVLHVEDGSVTDETITALRERRIGRRHTPVPDALLALLRPLLNSLVIDDTEYEELFDRTEVLLGVLAEDQRLQADANQYRRGAWFGRYTWRYRDVARPLERSTYDEFRNAGDSWPPLTAGLFGGSVQRAESAFASFLPRAESVRHERH